MSDVIGDRKNGDDEPASAADDRDADRSTSVRFSSDAPTTVPPPPPQRRGSSGGGSAGASSVDDFLERGRRSFRGARHRISRAADVVTGSLGGTREQVCQVRAGSMCQPMNPNERRRKDLRGMLVPPWGAKDSRDALQESVRSKDSASAAGGGGGEGDEEAPPAQYKLTSKRRQPGKLRAAASAFGISTRNIASQDYTTTSAGGDHWCQPNRLVTRYLQWTFRTSFALLFLSALAVFFGLTFLFALFIFASGRNHPECITVGDGYFGQEGRGGGRDLGDAFALSWTTFSTVGYGHTYPSVSVSHPDQSECTGITILCSLEAFIGVLFAAMAGSIIFGKVARIQSHAQVIFGDPIVIRYGSGIVRSDDDDDASSCSRSEGGAGGPGDVEEGGGSRGGRSYNPKKIPCPYLEFRVVNRLHSTEGGEIMDATMLVVAALNAKTACPTLLGGKVGALNLRKGKRKKRKAKQPPERKLGGGNGNHSDRGGGLAASLTSSLQSLTSGGGGGGGGGGSGPSVGESPQDCTGGGAASNRIDDRPGLSARSADSAVTDLSGESVMTLGSDAGGGGGALPPGALVTPSLVQALNANQAVDEDPTARYVPRRIFSRVEIESPDHPFFKRVWLARHVLDADSPLLTSRARHLVKKNKGFWPESLNNHRAIRDSVQFEQILVSLSGTSNVSASSVYAQKSYDYVDMNVGYRFANVLYRDDRGALCVDPSILNDVMEQNGGGAEPFIGLDDYQLSEVGRFHA